MELTLTRKLHLSDNAWLFTFTPSRPITWLAGQFIRVQLDHPHPDAEGTKRHFTIASAPADGVIEIATRITPSTFKHALSQLSTGQSISMIDPPAGDFVWPDYNSPPILFVAQGIGITPIRSMLRQRRRLGMPLNAKLIHSNVKPGVPFRTEIESWTDDPNFNLIFVTQSITASLLAHLVTNLSRMRIYASGPQQLTRLMLPPINLPPTRLKQDLFPNYSTREY